MQGLRPVPRSGLLAHERKAQVLRNQAIFHQVTDPVTAKPGPLPISRLPSRVLAGQEHAL